jgi:hypothetical protein
MCDHPGSTPQDYLAEVHAKMLAYGWAVQYVADRRPFAYTVGLTRCGLPELLLTGAEPLRAHRLLTLVAQMAVTGDPPTRGMRISLPDGPVVEMVEVEHPEAHLLCAGAIFGEVSALQVVWADELGRWPWAPDFDYGRGTQPVLGMRAVSN